MTISLREPPSLSRRTCVEPDDRTTSVENLVIENGDTPPTCTAADSSDARCVSTPAEAGITISKALTTESGSTANVVEAGETLTYTITFSPMPAVPLAPSPLMVETVPAGTTFVAAGNDFATATCVDGAAAATVCSLSSPNVLLRIQMRSLDFQPP